MNHLLLKQEFGELNLSDRRELLEESSLLQELNGLILEEAGEEKNK